jgi:hypothetical protein
MTDGHRQVRQYLMEELVRDLVGPTSVNEELPERPTSRYLTGILFPRDTRIDPEEDQDAGESADPDDGIDQGVLMATTTNPSAIGMTFSVRSGTGLRVGVSAAVYLEVTHDGASRSHWQRKQLEIPAKIIEASGNYKDEWALASGLRLMTRFRERGAYNVVTLSLVNTQRIPPDGEQTLYCFFQPEIEVTSTAGDVPVFEARRRRSLATMDEDRALNELLYRHTPEYAIGHGCAVEWEANEDENARLLRTSLTPSYELLQFSPDPEVPYQAQEMLFLANAESGTLTSALLELLVAYRNWIGRLKTEEVPASMREIARRHAVTCQEVADRIEQGIQMLSEDRVARQAFQLANSAMLRQRARVTWTGIAEEERAPAPAEDASHRWRPFQLAFILLCIPSIVLPDDPYRRQVDLLWFPTGGGKTEAYLGLTAFTIFLRRMRHAGGLEGAGVTVLMRYTLRLLTIQQFQRASTLIMACEELRRNDPAKLGTQPISLGLWVGGGATPNRLRDARAALERLQNEEFVTEGSPYQIHECPWCGTVIEPWDYRIEATMAIRCPNPTCDFDGDLPVYVVDDDIYQRRPTLIIGTVDKFARLPWIGETAALFGGMPATTAPPELIIQDELHLISGPLGSLVGLYETAIDLLCTHNGIPPKIIASTATIRRAAEQSAALFDRGFSQFPPPGLDARDSFFSVQLPPEQKPGRLYLGVHAPGRSMKTALLRIYAALMQRLGEHRGNDGLRDPYWTLVGYFNSTRELGGAVRLVADDVPARIRFLAREAGEPERIIEAQQELYSHVPGSEITRILNDMKQPMGRPGCLDVLLATNMISVGVDVDRLSLMVVTGQPKLTAEYIQATSRVGRRFPGLVVTLYNWTRPRDRSHYERFVSYHSSIYSQVEPTSVTPFSSRARDRGLHAVFVAMIRHTMQQMHPEEAAALFDPGSSGIQELIDRIVERVSRVDADEAEETRYQLQAICERWQTMASYGGDLLYGRSRRGAMRLMEAAEAASLRDGMAFSTLNSLRDVEGEAGVSVRLMRAQLEH